MTSRIFRFYNPTAQEKVYKAMKISSEYARKSFEETEKEFQDEMDEQEKILNSIHEMHHPEEYEENK